MKVGRIGDNDSLFRHLIFPLAFRGRAFQWNKGMKLFDESDGTILASLAWERYLPTTALIHSYGCRLASRMTESERKKGKNREKDRRIYCGAYQFKANLVRALSATEGLDEVVSADVIQHFEDGELAHTDLRFVLRSNLEFDLEGTKTAILDRLWNTCFGPLVHRCVCDIDVSPHPNEDLPNSPSGPYRDSRSFVGRLWCILRFHISSWLLSGSK
jgi:hypothetical protein